ncbi:MAG: hypothetical protein HY052_01025 [Proteobacteria bacterium]|nr:hypothetical protein [Pseudomonadota bacterium]
MSREYAMSRVKDALEKSDDNHLKAQRLLFSWIEKDNTLLLGLVAPHINGIIAHAITHATQPEKAAASKKINLKDQETGEFGGALLESLRGGRGDTGAFGEAAPRGVSKPGKASKAHVDAINTLVNATKKKDKKTKK